MSGSDFELTQAHIEHYQQHGYLVLDQVIGQRQLEGLKAQADRLLNQYADLAEKQLFSTSRNDRSGDDYFLQSSETIRCFFEEDAYDEAGKLVQQRALCINKIGHALHELDPVFRAFSHTPLLAAIARAIGIKTAQIRQSMYIFKQPRIGGEVKWHQDASFFVTAPHSVVTFWFAVEDATLQNGCLWVEPGGHKGPLREQFKRNGDDIRMIRLDNTPWPSDEQTLAVEVKAGSVVVFHGFLPHYSAPNRSDKSRQAYTLHVTDGGCEYSKDNWLQARELPLRGF